jgi:hypothetical protein
MTTCSTGATGDLSHGCYRYLSHRCYRRTPFYYYSLIILTYLSFFSF